MLDRNRIDSGKDLACQLARQARVVCSLINKIYLNEKHDGSLHALLVAIQTCHQPALNLNSFAETIAQLLASALFMARAGGRSIEHLTQLRTTNPLLNGIFQALAEVATREPEFQLAGVVRINEILSCAYLDLFCKDTDGYLTSHFYQLFQIEFKKYLSIVDINNDNKEDDIASGVIRLDRYLRDKLNYRDGLADTGQFDWQGKRWPRVMVLDTAVGDGSYLQMVIDFIYQYLQEQWHKAGRDCQAAWQEYVPIYLLPRLYGFEAELCSYSLAYQRLTYTLARTGYQLSPNERLGLYLAEPQARSLELFVPALDLANNQLLNLFWRESMTAATIRHNTPHTVDLRAGSISTDSARTAQS